MIVSFTADDLIDPGGQFSMRNVPASSSSAVTLGNTSSNGPPGFQHLTPMLHNNVTQQFSIQIKQIIFYLFIIYLFVVY
jgi:hypothetical protein